MFSVYYKTTQSLFFTVKNINIDVSHIENLITARNQARKDKNWLEADRIRNQLSDMSVILEDGPKGTTWKFTG